MKEFGEEVAIQGKANRYHDSWDTKPNDSSVHISTKKTETANTVGSVSSPTMHSHDVVYL